MCIYTGPKNAEAVCGVKDAKSPAPLRLGHAAHSSDHRRFCSHGGLEIP